MPWPWVTLLEEGHIWLDGWNLSSYDLLVRLAKGYVVKPCHTSSIEVLWALQTSALGIIGQWVKLYNFYRNIWPVITVVLTDTSDLDPSWLVATMDGWEMDIILIIHYYHLGLGLFTKVAIQDAKTWTIKIANHSQTVSSLLSLIDPFDILAKHGELTLALHSISRGCPGLLGRHSPVGSLWQNWASFSTMIVIILPLSKLCINIVMRYVM